MEASAMWGRQAAEVQEGMRVTVPRVLWLFLLWVHSWPSVMFGLQGGFFICLSLVSVFESSARRCTVCVSIVDVTLSLCFL